MPYWILDNKIWTVSNKYPRSKDRASSQSNLEVQIHTFTRIDIVIASRILVQKITKKNRV